MKKRQKTQIIDILHIFIIFELYFLQFKGVPKKTPKREFIKKLWIINVSLNQQKNVKGNLCILDEVYRLVLY